MTLDDIFNEQEDKKDTVKAVSSSSLTTNDIFGEENKIQKPVYKSDVERFKEDISRRKENIQQIANREIEGKQSKTSSFFQTSGQILGVATDFIGEAIVTLGQIGKKVFYDPLPETSKEKFRTEFVDPIKKGIIEPTSKKISSGEQKTVEQSLQERDLPSLIAGRVNKYQSFKEKNPETAYNIEAGLNVFDFIDTFAVAPALIKGGIKKGIKEARQEAFEQTQKKVTKEVSDQIKKEAIELDYSSKKLTKSFLGGMTSKDVDKYKDDLSRVLSFVTDNDKAVISKSKNATDDFINVFQKNRTDIGNVADGLARQVDDVVDVEMYYIGNELEKKFKDRLKSLSTDITKMGDKVANKEALYINNYIKQLKASQNYSASEAFERLKKLNSELSDYYTRKKQPGFTSTKKEKIAIELKSGEADILRNRLYAKIDNALGNNMFSRIRRAQEAFENVNSKVLPKIKQRNKLASLDLNEDSFIRGIDAGTKAIRVDQPLTIPRRLVDAGKTFFGLEDTKLNNTIKNVFKNLPTKQGIPIKDLVADITNISLKNLDIIKEERYMSDFLQELWKNQDVALLPPPSVIIMPEFSDSAYQAMKDVKLTPPEIVNNRIDYQIWVNELNRRPEIKLLTEKATEVSKMQGTVSNPIIPKAPTTYEAPAAKIGNEDFKRIEKFIQDQEALKVFKGNQNKAYEIVKSKFDTIKENYPALVETIESHPLHDIINKQSKSGEFAGKLSDKASNLDNLLMERGYDDVEQGREAFEGLKELIYRRQRTEKEMSDLYGNLKEIKAGNKTIIDDYVNPISTEIEDIDFGTTDTSIKSQETPIYPIRKSFEDGYQTIKNGELGDGIIDNSRVKELEKEINKTKKVWPIEIDKEGFIVDGEHRYKALINLGVEDIPVFVGEQMGSTGRLKNGGYQGMTQDIKLPSKIKNTSIEPKVSSTSSELIEEARKYDNVDDFINRIKGSSTQYGDYTPNLRQYGMEDYKNVADLGINPDETITIYRGIDTTTGKIKKQINDGDFVTTDFDSALSYTGDKKNVISMEVPAKTLYTDAIKDFKDEPFYTGSEYVYTKQKVSPLTKDQLRDIYNQAKKTK